MAITIRVSAKTSAGEFRTIRIADDGSNFECDCKGYSVQFCAHIDAVLVAQERAMVHLDDWAAADRAVALLATRVVIPDDWKGSWRKNLKWRGLSSRGASTRRVRSNNKPLVCFTGNPGRPRAELKAEAELGGWETIDSPSPYTDVLVAADPLGTTGKLKAARKNGTPIVTLDEWTTLMTDGVLRA